MLIAKYTAEGRHTSRRDVGRRRLCTEHFLPKHARIIFLFNFLYFYYPGDFLENGQLFVDVCEINGQQIADVCEIVDNPPREVALSKYFKDTAKRHYGIDEI